MELPLATAAVEALRAVLLFGYAALFALVEIEIEGPDGWAEKLPTWYRVKPWYARAFVRVMGGKPLTGYHAVMIPLAFASFHVGLAFGQPWSAAIEARTVATFLFWSVIWDLLWFIWNPAFGWARFRPGQVWWLGRVWIARFPLEYWTAIAWSFAVASLPVLLGSDRSALARHAVTVATLGLLVAGVATPLGPLYRRWYGHMRRPGADERALAIKR
jgi:hypothetical protein